MISKDKIPEINHGASVPPDGLPTLGHGLVKFIGWADNDEGTKVFRAIVEFPAGPPNLPLDVAWQDRPVALTLADLKSEAHSPRAETEAEDGPWPATGLEPRGCPTPGACSCPPPTPTPDALVERRERAFTKALRDLDGLYGCNLSASARQILDRFASALEARAPASGDAEGYREKWNVGDLAWFEYHCNPAHNSADAQIWYRSHQQVEVIDDSEKLYDPAPDLDTLRKRSEAGQPRVYRVRFADGLEWAVWEAELYTERRFFTPEFKPPSPVEIARHLAALAASPATPEGENENKHGVGRAASGLPTWLPIESAPKDGTIILVPDFTWGVTTVRWHRDGWSQRGSMFLAYPNFWLPSPLPPTNDKSEAQKQQGDVGAKSPDTDRREG